MRTFDGNSIRPQDREKLREYIAAGLPNPFNIPVDFVLLDAEAHGLSSPVIAGETLYVAGREAKVPRADVAFGYSFEGLVLYAWSLGIGSTWIGGTMKRALFEQAAGLKAGETMPCVSPLGYLSKKKSAREVMMRRSVGADNRMPAEKLFLTGVLIRRIPAQSRVTCTISMRSRIRAMSAMRREICRRSMSASLFVIL